MSSQEHEMDLPRSMKNLFTLLSGSLNLKSHQFIATELSRNTKQLTNGLLFYQKHNPSEDSLEALNKKKTIDSLPVEVLAKTSVFLNLSSEQCKELFHSYLIYEFKGTPEMVKTLFTNDIRVKQLLTELNQYYYSERLFTLFCMKQILSHWKTTSDHVYKQIFHTFLEKINENNELLPKLISQLTSLNKSSVPSRLTNGPYFSDNIAKEWVYNNMKEQTEVLELLLLYLKEFETSIDTILELLNVFRKNGFALKFTHLSRNETDFVDEEVFRFIGFLESLIIVECLDVKWLYECELQDIECQLIKKDNAKQLKQLEDIITNLSANVVEHSPIFWAWMIVRSWQIPEFNDDSGQLMDQLGNNILQMNVFTYLEKCLNLPQSTALKGTVVSDLIYRSIGDMLFVSFNIFESMVHNIPSISHLCIKLFQSECIAKEVFKNGLDSGLGLIVSQALKQFPFKVNPILSFCHSLSKSEFCKPIFEKLSILSNLTSYAEHYDSSMVDIIPTAEDNNIFILAKDKMLYRDTDLLIKKGTKGRCEIISNQKMMEWFDINIDGWKLVYHRYKEQYDLVSRGQLYAVSDLAVIEMSQITCICSQLIKHNCYHHISAFNRLIVLCFETYELFSTVDKQFPSLMASILELSASVAHSGLITSSSLWTRIAGKRFMPYMIGLMTDLNELVNGNDTNTSTLGQVIASHECLKGVYDLCISFLTLIAEAVKTSDLKDDSDLMASIIFITNEIFPSHHFWNYKDINQFHKIGRLCFDIFYTILIKANKSSTVRNKTEQIVILSLMEGKSAQTLLKVIKSGEINVRNVILSAGNDNCLSDDDEIVIVRQSLSTLNRLLVLHERSAASLDPSGVMAIALFAPQNKPNMLIILSHYVFQRYDTYLATLAVQLLRELAICFPMSMLACLGSEAEALRDHFLNRLEEVTEDLNLKIALLNFMSACAERQPGLMEMFLNVDNPDSENTTGCLQTVLEILEEKRDAKYFCPFELHLSSLKFLYTFWIGPHLLAIDSLKKTSNVWTLITFPLFEDNAFNDILCVYILRILAREIFYVKTLERDKFESDLEDKFKTMRETDRLLKLSTHIKNKFEAESDVDEECLQLLSAWKEFLISTARFDPFDIKAEMKTKLTEDIVDSLLSELNKNNFNKKAITTLSDILLMILVKWKETAIESEEEFNKKIGLLMKRCEQIKESLPFNFLITIESSVTQYLKLVTDDFNSCDLMVYSSEFLNQSLRIIEKQLKGSKNHLEIEFRLSVTSICLLQSLVNQNKSRAHIWINILRDHFIIESLSNLLIQLIERQFGLELAIHIMSLLVELSSIETSAKTLYLIGFADNLCIALQNTYYSGHETDIKSKYNSTLKWTQVFYLSMRMIVNLVHHLRHHFVENAITFVAIHLDYVIEVLTKLRTSPKNEDISQSIVIVTLSHSLSYYHQIWRTSHPISYQRMQEQLLKTCNSVIAFLIRPNYLGYLMESTDNSKTIKPLEKTPKKFSPTIDFESQTLRKSISWETELSGHSLESSVTDSLFTFQAFAIGFFQNISPNILQLLERQGFGNEWNLLINTSFSSPNVDPNTCLSFGSLINCIHMCIKTINRNEKTCETESGKSRTHCSLLVFIFETSLSFMVTQAMVAQMSSAITDVDKQIIIREIKSELNTVISNVSPRTPKRHSQSSLTPRSSSTTYLIEQSFVKFLLQFVERISQ